MAAMKILLLTLVLGLCTHHASSKTYSVTTKTVRVSYVPALTSNLGNYSFVALAARTVYGPLYDWADNSTIGSFTVKNVVITATQTTSTVTLELTLVFPEGSLFFYGNINNNRSSTVAIVDSHPITGGTGVYKTAAGQGTRRTIDPSEALIRGATERKWEIEIYDLAKDD